MKSVQIAFLGSKTKNSRKQQTISSLWEEDLKH